MTTGDATKPVAVVTGASRGLGASIARRLADDGWAVGCLATSAESASAISTEIEASGGSAVAVGARVEDRDALEAALDQVESGLGLISLMVNNAGISQVAPFLETDPADFARIIDINLLGVFHGSQAAARRMAANGLSGSIIQMGSMAGRVGFPKRVGYCGTKAAVHHMTKVMAVDLAPHKIRVNAVAPGYIRTDMIQNLFDTGTLDEAPLQARVPQGELGDPDHIAAAVAWLASDESSYVTGEVLTVDGGWTAYGHI